MSSSPIVLSLGGSLIAKAEGIDLTFLKTFRAFLRREVAKGQRCIVVVGGGVTARHYMQAADAIARPTAEEKDWMGIYATRCNAMLVRALFGDLAHPVIIEQPQKRVRWTTSILVAGGWKPGWSTDYVATVLAKRHGAKTIVNLTNIERVCSADPKTCVSARTYDRLTWKDYRDIVGSTWRPGMSTPFDPIASAFAQKAKMRVIVAMGSDLKNLQQIMENKPFVGTVLEG
ncbi:MAG: UMP kinase [Patescibacteria group bacterium]